MRLNFDGSDDIINGTSVCVNEEEFVIRDGFRFKYSKAGETNTHLQIVEGLVDRLIALGKRFDYMLYPHRNHGISEGKATSIYLRMLMVRYLLRTLPPGLY